jgi:ABC-2 type transport system ATP-binding protein
VLNNIKLTFEQGQVYGIVGKNGAGKTTLFRCLANIESYTGIIQSPHNILKNHLGLLETNPIFLSRITGWEYLKLLCIARNVNTDDFEDQNIFDLPLNQYTETYSTGMKKKLALMAILLQKNDVFILDEPFNGVDIQSNILISAIIEKLKKQNKIVIISSHIFSTLSDSCYKIFLMKNGAIEKGVVQEDYQALEEEIKRDIVDQQIDRLRI